MIELNSTECEHVSAAGNGPLYGGLIGATSGAAVLGLLPLTVGAVDIALAGTALGLGFGGGLGAYLGQDWDI